MRKKIIIPLTLLIACISLTSCKEEEEPLDTSIYDSLQTSLITSALPKTESAEGEETTEGTEESAEIDETSLNDSDIYMVSGTVELSGNKLTIVSDGETYDFILSDDTQTDDYNNLVSGNYNAVLTYKVEADGKIKIISFTGEEITSVS